MDNQRNARKGRLAFVIRRMAIAACGLFALANAGAAAGATFFQYSGQPHEFVTNGVGGTLSAPATTFSTNANSGVVSIVLSGGADLVITAPSGQSLATGTYQLGAPLGLADLTVGVNGRSCGNTTGQLTISELSLDLVNHVVLALAADFVVHCSSEDELFAGGIRINSAVAYSDPPLSFAGPASFQYTSQSGDFVGSGNSATFTRADGTFEPNAQAANAVGLFFDDFTNLGIFWELVFQAPNAAVLTPGTYSTAQRWPFQSAGLPGFQVFGDGRGCNTLIGNFTVLDVQLDAYGAPTVLAVDFEQHCEGQGPAMTGALRYNSNLAYTPTPPAAVPAGMHSLDGTSFAVPAGSTHTGPRIVVANSDGTPAVNATVHFTTLGCGSLAGGPSVDVVTDASGIAQAPNFTVPNAAATCYLVATVTGTSIPAYYVGFLAYLPSELVITPLPSAAFHVGLSHSFNVGVQVSLRGLALSGAPVTFTVVPGTGAPSSLGSSAITDAGGTARVQGISGASAGTFTVQIGVGGSTQVITVAQDAPAPPAPPPPLVPGTRQDMWWNPGENGWGMALVDHGDALFGAFFIYDTDGKQTWVVMPQGSWDSTQTVYTGALYKPKGTPFFAYDPRGFQPGSAVGSVTITFDDNDHATLDFTGPGLAGTKFVVREAFANGDMAQPDRSDLWWGGESQNGWGITIVQQANTLFSVWYTYDSSGNPVWYVMPGGAWTASDTYEGALYRTAGSPWAGVNYDPSKLQVFSAGTYKIQFNGDSATFTYTADGHSGTVPLVKEPF